MLQIDKDGRVLNAKVRLTYINAQGKTANAISPLIQQGPMPVVRGIIVHQTDTTKAVPTLDTYQRKYPNGAKPDGAHFLIEKDGTIYQTAPVNRRCAHVGKLQSRCLHEMTCPPAELKLAKKWDPNGTYEREKKKQVPERYPSNLDSIGIECVGKSYKHGSDGKKLTDQTKDLLKGQKVIYEPLTAEQKQSLKWLIREIAETLNVPMTEVYRHPVVSYKTRTEAETAQEVISELQGEDAKARRIVK